MSDHVSLLYHLQNFASVKNRACTTFVTFNLPTTIYLANNMYLYFSFKIKFITIGNNQSYFLNSVYKIYIIYSAIDIIKFYVL